MRASYKIFLCAGLFVAAIMLGYFDVYPAFLEEQAKTQDLKQRQATNDLLVKQLEKRHQADLEKTKLETDIATLHDAVPKTAEVDLLVLDLEKIATSCDLDLVGVENPDAESLKQFQASEEQLQSITHDSGNKLALGARPVAKADTKKKDVEEVDKQPALKSLPKIVYVTGNYDNFVKLMHKLETYQRIIGVKNISIAMPGQSSDVKAPALDRANKLKLTQPMMSFLMTIYYLP